MSDTIKDMKRLMSKREQWLERQLNSGVLNPEVAAEYEAEMDAIADRITHVQKLNEEAAKKTALERAELREKILTNDADVIFVLGQEEFGADYQLKIEGIEFVVYSHVAQDSQESRRPHITMELAMSDLRYLYYNRLYDRYVRTGEMDELRKLA